MTSEVDTQDSAQMEGGSYEVIKKRLREQGAELARRANALNERRTATFGGTVLSVLGNARVRTENNCVPRDIVNVGGKLLFGYNVFLGLKTGTAVADVFSLQSFTATEAGFELAALPLDAVPGLFDSPAFTKEFAELYQYYRDAKLHTVRRPEGKLLAVFQIGERVEDVKAFRWAVSPTGAVQYIDNRGERDHVYPPSHDFEWVVTTRDDHVRGRYPHVNILNQVFVETVGGDLTVKVEDNTEDGLGIYREPVDDPRQSLDDAEIHYAKVGGLILLKILPYQETTWRYLVFNTRNQDVRRIDAIGQACVQLPEDHGVVFPGGYYLQTGDFKVFGDDITDLHFKRQIRAPNGEDVLYVFYQPESGRYLLLPYNLIKKEVTTPIHAHGMTLLDDGKMLVFRANDEPTRVHPMQIWQTPFMSDEFAAQAPTDGSFLAKVGNAELVRGISDCFSLRRLIEADKPTRRTFEDLIAGVTRTLDAYYWLDNAEVGDLKAVLAEIKHNADLIVGEFEKVLALRKKAEEALEAAKKAQADLVRELRPEDWRQVDTFLMAMTDLRTHRGHLISLKDVRYMDLAAVDALEKGTIEQFERVSQGCVRFLLTGQAFDPLLQEMEALLKQVGALSKAKDVEPLSTQVEKLSEGLNLLSEVVAGLEVEDATQRTSILESISEVFSTLNRVRATIVARRKELMGAEGRAEFAAQFKLLGQAVSSAIALADSPEKCDEQLSRLMVQLEDLEGRFSEFDEFLADLSSKREEIYEALEGKKQQLMDERQRRAANLGGAATRILEGVSRRTRTFKGDDELNAYFASDPMVMKLRQLVEQLRALGDTVKADDVEARVKSARQDAVRNLRDKQDLFEGGDNVIKLGRHRFTVNTQSFELTLVPRDEDMYLHLTGTDFFEKITDAAFGATREYWAQQVPSETDEVYRGEYLAASILFDAERGAKGLTLPDLVESARDEQALLQKVRAYAADRYDEGYERGLHDADAARILERLLAIRQSAGLLRFAPTPRAWACLFWARFEDSEARAVFQRRAQSLGRLRRAFRYSQAEETLAQDLGQAVAAFLTAEGVPHLAADARMAGRYLMEELVVDHPRFTTGLDAVRLKAALLEHLELEQSRAAFEEDLSALADSLKERLALAEAWTLAFLDNARAPEVAALRPALVEAAVLLLTPELPRTESAALTRSQVTDLLGQHPRVQGRTMELRLDEFLSRLTRFMEVRVPGYQAFREARHALLERERLRLRLDEFKPRVLTSFVRNRLINDVYLPMIGDNLAKQLGAAGQNKRTDLMGLLLLVSPPGYGKTTLMEYMASRLGMVFMKVNGPSLGHAVLSLDPAEAPNATARQEVEKVNLAFEMANNVMLYLDDIQHTNPEFLQKFISLCDAQRRVEGVWGGRTRTYDLRGKKFCVVMAGNPYTESGEKFQIPDMLANRADTYNLGDILEGKDQVFALSYIENALTSNPTLAPVAARSLQDMHLFIKMAQGEEVPQTEFQHSYSGVEIEELTQVLQRLFKVQEVLLKVNLQYIQSASQDDRFRTEPRFQLQGSYRNMNKLAEKTVAALNDAELQRLVTDHYQGESQTLTSGAEANLLKLAELRGLMTPAEVARWDQIKRDFRRLQVQGGGDDDPVTRVTSTLGALGEHLEGIQGRIEAAVAQAQRHAEAEAARAGEGQAWLVPHLERLDQAVQALAQPKLSVALKTEAPKELQDILTRQLAALEASLVPLVHTSARNLEEVRALGRPLLELIELLKLNALAQGAPPRAS
jgi:hypothetical protein